MARYDLPQQIKAKGVYPYFRCIESEQDTEVMMNGRRVLMFGSNSYLGLTNHPRVIAAAAEATRQYGTGCAGSRFLNGTIDLHLQLEHELAQWVGKEDAMVYSTGFQVNLGVVSCVTGKDDYAICDELDHASIVEGRRLSFSTPRKYRHTDMASLERELSRCRPDAVKLGMVASAELIETIADRLSYYKAENIVVDPVMVATSGSELMKSNAVTVLRQKLLPLATLVTPNIPEAEVLSGESIQGKEDMERVAKLIGDAHGCAVLLKGGHSVSDANDLLYANSNYKWFYGKRIDNPNTHGTGCTLSSAIASNLAKGYDLEASIERAKDYISGALGAMLDLGQGSGPMNHAFDLRGKYSQ